MASFPASFSSFQTDTEREAMVRERLREFSAPRWLIAGVNTVTAFAVAGIALQTAGQNPMHIYLWLGALLLSVPLRFWAVQNLHRWFDRVAAMNAGFAIGILGSLFYAYAGHQFTVSMTELGLYKMVGALALISLPTMMVHALFRGRMLVLMAIIWLPILFRLTAPDTDFHPDLIITIVTVLAAMAWVCQTYIGIFRHLVHGQIEQEQSSLTLETKQTELQKAHSDQHIFFLAANHDIRQPLQAVMAYGVALEQSVPAENTHVRDLLRKLQRSIHNLGELIDETLRFAKIAAGEEKPKLDIVPTQAIVDRLRNKFEPTALSKGVALRIRGDRLTLFTDPGLLERVLANLVSNALRYTDQGGVLVAFRPRGDMCSIEVWDTGIGIKAEEQEQVFETFYQGSNRRASGAGAQKGHGLGLTIVQQLCAQMGTQLELTSALNKGTRIRFLVRMVSDCAIDDALGELPQVQQNFTGTTIAIVEDDRAIRESLGAVLAGVHATVISAASIAEFEVRAKGVERIDFMVADLHVAGRLGTDAIRMARQKYPALDGVIITGDASDAVLQSLRRDGFRMILKPVDPNALLTLIFDSIASRQRSQRIGSMR